MTYRSRKLLDLARDQACVLCGVQDGTVVAAHRNQGKGMGWKVPDYWTAHLCSRCHVSLDQGGDMSREERRAMWNEAFVRTVARLFDQGRVAVK